MIGTTGSSGLERRRFIRLLGALGAATAGGGLASGCGSANRSDRGPGGATIRIGYLTPTTGALASYGAADRFVIGAMRQFFAQNPIRVGGRSYPVEILDRDSQSNADRAADLTDDLIANGGIQLMLVSAGAQTATPVSDQCEANGMPCIATATPWQPWFYGRAGRPDTPFRWTYDFFWGLDDVEAVYADMWDQVGTNKRCAGLWPDDADGRAWGDPTSGFPAATERARLRLHRGPALRHRDPELQPADRGVRRGRPGHPGRGAGLGRLHHLLEAGHPAGLPTEDRDDRQGAAVPVQRRVAGRARGEPGHRGVVVAAAPVHLIAHRADRPQLADAYTVDHRPAVDPAARLRARPVRGGREGVRRGRARSTTGPAWPPRSPG